MDLCIPVRSIGSLTALAAALAGGRAAAQGCQTATQLASTSSAEVAGDSDSWGAALSADGRYVVFQSEATNFAAVQPGRANVFRRDRATGLTQLVSATAAGVAGNEDSTYGSISDDGRWVAFTTHSSNLVPGDTNGTSDVFVKDMHTGAIERASVSSFESQADGYSLWPEISGDGRYVAFQSIATNLLAIVEANGQVDVYLRDRLAGTTSLISVGPSGALGDGPSTLADVSVDGRFVAFQSEATNLVPGDTNGFEDVFVRDRATGTTLRASLAGSGLQGNDHSQGSSVSDDGRFVAFTTLATNLGGLDGNDRPDAYVRDLTAGATLLVSQSTSAILSTANGVTNQCKLSRDGRFAVFRSSSSNAVQQDSGSGYAIYVRDLQAATTALASLTSAGQPSQASCANPEISSDGAWVVFDSDWQGFSGIDANQAVDVFVRGVDCGFPQAYGSPKLTSNGCLPDVSWSGEAQADLDGGFVLTCSNVINQKSGLLFYGLSGPAAIPFQGGTLNVMPPTKRSSLVLSNGSPPALSDCSGRFVLDMDAFAAGALGGNPLPELQVVGTRVNAQWWGRDPGYAAPNDTLLSNAVEYTVRP